MLWFLLNYLEYNVEVLWMPVFTSVGWHLSHDPGTLTLSDSRGRCHPELVLDVWLQTLGVVAGVLAGQRPLSVVQLFSPVHHSEHSTNIFSFNVGPFLPKLVKVLQ